MPAEVSSQPDSGKRRRSAVLLPLPTRRLLRLREGAAYLSVSDKTLRKLVMSGELPVIKNGEGPNAPWLLDTKDLDKWIDSNKQILQ